MQGHMITYHSTRKSSLYLQQHLTQVGGCLGSALGSVVLLCAFCVFLSSVFAWYPTQKPTAAIIIQGPPQGDVIKAKWSRTSLVVQEAARPV